MKQTQKHLKLTGMRGTLVRCSRLAGGVILGLCLINNVKASYDSSLQTYSPNPPYSAYYGGPITQLEAVLLAGGLASHPGQFFDPVGGFDFSDPSWHSWLVQPDHLVNTGNSVADLTFRVKIQGNSDSDISLETYINVWGYAGTEAVAGVTWYYGDFETGLPENLGWYLLGPLDPNDAPNPTPVPEPTTMIAGALLLLPFGASTLRMLRKRQVA
jgi:hypothetical protein